MPATAIATPPADDAYDLLERRVRALEESESRRRWPVITLRRRANRMSLDDIIAKRKTDRLLHGEKTLNPDVVLAVIREGRGPLPASDDSE